jgi:hypothetical protein
MKTPAAQMKDVGQDTIALRKAINWISDQEQEIASLRKEVDSLRLRLELAPRQWPERKIK